MKKIIQSSSAPAPIGPYSQAVLAGNILFVSGQIPLDPATGQLVTNDIEKATSLVMQHLENILREAGMDFSHVVKTSIFLADMNDFPRVNEIYGKFFEGMEPPARETVQVARLPKDVQVEISMIAVK